MEAGRFWSHMAPLIAVITIYEIAVRLTSTGTKKIVLHVLIFLQVLAVLMIARYESTGRPLWQLKDQNRLWTDKSISFFDYANRIHRRDMPVIRVLKELITKIKREKKKVVLFSGQMGFVMYHVVL